tara:strand:- start:9397 stop:10422 length:1026 start_codon:yes stop_codon:yes gene_type:complete
MRILYLSCHSILEYDEVRLLHGLGHEVFSPGAYVEPRNPGDATLRPGLSFDYDPDILQQFHELAAKHPGEDTKDYLTQEFVDNFDVVIVMHIPRWIQKNWHAFKNVRVIWRTIGQSVSGIEASLSQYRDAGLEIIRYSPMERNIPGFLGQDALIRFYKDPNDYKGWTGEQRRVITFAQHMKDRDQACNFSFFEEVTRDFPRHLFGPGNGDIGEWTSGKVSTEQQMVEYQTNRCYFYTGTHPASYTLNFMEAWMTGIPIVAIGSDKGNAGYFPGHDLYEIPSLIENGVTGFVSNSHEELSNYIKTLLGDREYAQKISDAARDRAIEIFGRGSIAAQWSEYLG